MLRPDVRVIETAPEHTGVTADQGRSATPEHRAPEHPGITTDQGPSATPEHRAPSTRVSLQTRDPLLVLGIALQCAGHDGDTGMRALWSKSLNPVTTKTLSTHEGISQRSQLKAGSQTSRQG